MKAIGYLCFDGEPVMRSEQNARMERAKAELIQKSEPLGLELIQVYADLRMDPESVRSGLEIMLRHFAKEEMQAVALQSLQALSDTPAKMLEFFQVAARHDIMIFILDQGAQIRPSESKRIAKVLELATSYEKRLSTLRISRGLKQASLLGRKIGRSRFEDHGDTKVIEEILAMRKRGLSLRDICRALNTSKVPTHSQRSWHPTTVKRLLERHVDEVT